jgi:hypothetical protein
MHSYTNQHRSPLPIRCFGYFVLHRRQDQGNILHSGFLRPAVEAEGDKLCRPLEAQRVTGIGEYTRRAHHLQRDSCPIYRGARWRNVCSTALETRSPRFWLNGVLQTIFRNGMLTITGVVPRHAPLESQTWLEPACSSGPGPQSFRPVKRPDPGLKLTFINIFLLEIHLK